MKRKEIINILSIIGLLFMVSCEMEENPPYNFKFVHIMYNEASELTVSSYANTVSTYNVYLSSKQMKEPVNVTYDIIVGDGLEEDIDYKILTKGNTLTFLPGIYDMPIRIQWIDNPVEENEDNTLTIKILSADQGFNVGLPGPDHEQTELIITKI